MKLITKLEHGLVQVYFHSLPLGAILLHKGNFYEKIGSEYALKDGKQCTIEPNYGCLISEEQFKIYKLTEEDIRDDSPEPQGR